MNTKELLDERAKTHGPYVEQWRLAQQLKDLLPGPLGTAVQREALEMICTKISRIAVGDASYAEHWEDIAGYATRVVESLKPGEENVSTKRPQWPPA